jgi:ribosome-binding ATPase YchF (GTP1/OBG family)
VKVGLVGFAGSGKSTLFDVLTLGHATAGAERVATVALEDDEYFLFLCDHYLPKKRTPVSFELHDFGGLPPAGKGEERARIAAFRDAVDALVLVVRGFTTDAYFYPKPEADPARDAADLFAELLLADLDVATRRAEKLRISVTKPTPKQDAEKRELAALEKVIVALESEVPVKAMELSPDEEKLMKGYAFLTAKPWALLVSLPDEGGEVDPKSVPGPFESRAALRVKLEAELMELDEPERTEFMEDLGVEKLLLPDYLDRLLLELGMIRFYTVSEKEVHCWELPKGSDVVTAAGRIHTDMARGFIRAEITGYEDFRKAGSEREAKAMGLTRVEGRDYVVKDGDLVYVRFSV